MAEPLYDADVDAWLDSLVDDDPDLLTRVEDQIDLLRQEPIPPQARRRQFRTKDGGFCFVIAFEAGRQPWLLIWTTTISGQAVVVAIEPTESL